MSKKQLSIIDKAGAIIYPRLHENETQVEGARNDIIKSVQHETYYFPLEFRLKDVVIDSLARKYASEYPSADEVAERFLIGTAACSEDHRNELHCPYMDKVTRSLADVKSIRKSNIVALSLLDADDSADYHNQGFLLLSKDGVYLRNTGVSNKIEHYAYQKLRFTRDGIEHIERTSVEGLLLNYPLDEKFIGFAQEFMLLRRTTLLTMRDRHPFADAFPQFRKAYLEILTDVAAAEGFLTVEKYIRLEYMAREFRIAPASFEQWLRTALKGTGKDAELQKKFREMLSQKTKTDEWYVLFQDILEMAVREDGLNRKKIVDLLRRNSTAGDKFVSNCIEYIKLRRQSELYLHRAVESIGYRRLADDLGGYLKKIHALLSYNGDMNLKLLDTDILSNER